MLKGNPASKLVDWRNGEWVYCFYPIKSANGSEVLGWLYTCGYEGMLKFKLKPYAGVY